MNVKMISCCSDGVSTCNHLLKVELASSGSSHTSLPATWQLSQLLTRCRRKGERGEQLGSSRRETTAAWIPHRRRGRKMEWAEKDIGGTKEENRGRNKRSQGKDQMCVRERPGVCVCSRAESASCFFKHSPISQGLRAESRTVWAAEVSANLP